MHFVRSLHHSLSGTVCLATFKNIPETSIFERRLKEGHLFAIACVFTWTPLVMMDGSCAIEIPIDWLIDWSNFRFTATEQQECFCFQISISWWRSRLITLDINAHHLVRCGETLRRSTPAKYYWGPPMASKYLATQIFYSNWHRLAVKRQCRIILPNSGWPRETEEEEEQAGFRWQRSSTEHIKLKVVGGKELGISERSLS